MPVPHIIESAPSGRATCRGCSGKIPAGALRFGERLPNPYGDEGAEMTHWFHLLCAAYRRPEPLLETLASTEAPIPDVDQLRQQAQPGVTHRRLPRVSTAGRASSGRATCRACKESIAKDSWRIALVFYDDGRFVPSGFIHAACVQPYLEATDIMDRVRHFSPDLTDADLEELRTALSSAANGERPPVA
ncbi:MAG: PARP-type zinc finger-containing protein [Vicinamibacterales bacterium]